MARSAFGAGHEVVDLLSDSEDDTFTREELEFFDARSAQESVDDFPNLQEALQGVNAHFGITEHETIDLTAIPDIDVPPSNPYFVNDDSPEPSVQSRQWLGKGQLLTEAACVQMVLSVLPDISVDHVLKIIQENTMDDTRTTTRCEEILTEFLDGGAYPKEADEARNKKRKRGDDDDLSEYERADRDPRSVAYEKDASELLKDEFLSVPIRHITHVLQEHKTLYKAYGVLVEQVRNYKRVATPFSKIGKARVKRGVELMLTQRGSPVPKELHAAKKKAEQESTKRLKAEEEEQAEEANLQQAQTNNAMGECACCYNDVPLNRMISCNGDTTHFFCLDCPRKQVETLMGLSRCRLKCFGVDDCDGTFSRRHLQRVLSDRTFERLEHMQQLEDLNAAGLDFLSECPFCDFKMECPPVEVDKEFRCQNKKCSKTSCRLCEKESHIPLSCEEAKKDGQLTLRHVVEEAMSAALIRHCNNCKHAFIKEYGCNKMTCSHCRNIQCYVCSKNVTDYQHFGDAQRNKCPLHENIEDRHEQEVKRAADEAMAKVRADNPGLSDADLMIKVSDRVKQAEDARRGRAAVDANAFPYQMVGNALQNRGVPPPLPGGALVGAGPLPVFVGPQPAFPPPNAPRHNFHQAPHARQANAGLRNWIDGLLDPDDGPGDLDQPLALALRPALPRAPSRALPLGLQPPAPLAQPRAWPNPYVNANAGQNRPAGVGIQEQIDHMQVQAQRMRERHMDHINRHRLRAARPTQEAGAAAHMLRNEQLQRNLQEAQAIRQQQLQRARDAMNRAG